MSRAVRLVLLVPAVLLGLLLSWFSLWLAFRLLPAPVPWAALGIMALILVWFVFARGSGLVAGSESALMGRQSSKEGLL